MAEVPFADTSGGVAERLQCLGERGFAGRQTAGRVGEENAALAAHAAADRQSAGKQGSSARRTQRSRDVGAGVLLALGGHAVQVRRANGRMPVTTQVPVAQIVGKDDDKV